MTESITKSNNFGIVKNDQMFRSNQSKPTEKNILWNDYRHTVRYVSTVFVKFNKILFRSGTNKG